MYWVDFFLWVLVGIESLFILLLYERLVRANRKIWELEGIRKWEYFSKKRIDDFTNRVIRDINKEWIK